VAAPWGRSLPFLTALLVGILWLKFSSRQDGLLSLTVTASAVTTTVYLTCIYLVILLYHGARITEAPQPPDDVRRCSLSVSVGK